jgi:hypothetical protein
LRIARVPRWALFSSWRLSLNRRRCARQQQGGAEAGAGQSAYRPHRLLGLAYDRKLAAPNGDARQGYRRIRALRFLINA